MGLYNKISKARIILAKINGLLSTLEKTKVDDDILYETFDEYELVKHAIAAVKDKDIQGLVLPKVYSLNDARKRKQNE